jgi:catechol 2,3-dioxygenase-like lactoylglutathione lyase family enzyme
MTIQFEQVIPILRIFSIEKAREFYVGFLGFAVDWEARFDDKAPVYMQMSRGTMLLHLTEHHGDCCPGSTVHVEMRGLADYHREVNSKGYGFMRPGLEPAPWGADIMEVIDPFGNRIRFSQRHAAASVQA